MLRVNEYQHAAAPSRPVIIYQAKTQLSRLVERAVAGEEIVIAKAGKPMVRLIPVREPAERIFGAAKGRYLLPKGWERAMSDEKVEEFTNGGKL